MKSHRCIWTLLLASAALWILSPACFAAVDCSRFLGRQSLQVAVASQWLTMTHARGSSVSIYEVEGAQRLVGELLYTLSADGTVATTGHAHAKAGYTGNGLYRMLYNRLLQDIPTIQTIETGFLGANEDAVAKELQAGASHLDALRASPFYRAVSRLGFDLDPAGCHIAMGINVRAVRVLPAPGAQL